MKQHVRVGTRGSRLALAQTRMVIEELARANPGVTFTEVIVKTLGDKVTDVPLFKVGGQGLFIKEIQEAILSGEVDFGVHSLKDVPTHMPKESAISHVLPRGDARDVFISEKVSTLADLPAGSVVGTSSVRRQAIVKNIRPDLDVVTFRGNIDTRLEKLRQGQVDAIILAAEGLKRLSLSNVISSYIEPETMLPAVGQGVIGLETRTGDTDTRKWLDAIACVRTFNCIVAERALLMALDGSCGTPIGSYAQYVDGDTMRMRGLFAEPDGSAVYQAEEIIAVKNDDEAHALGLTVGRMIRAMTPEAALRAAGC